MRRKNRCTRLPLNGFNFFTLHMVLTQEDRKAPAEEEEQEQEVQYERVIVGYRPRYQ